MTTYDFIKLVTLNGQVSSRGRQGGQPTPFKTPAHFEQAYFLSSDLCTFN